MKNFLTCTILILFLTSCNTKTSISTDFLISSGKWCGVYYNTQNICVEFSPTEITEYRGEKKQILSVKYEKANDSIIYFYPLDGGEKNEIYLKSKDTITVGATDLSTNGYTSPE
tara:strand:- start:651 stop:992 length:342 start_codon:yes stop_codon:yes gene_type:complete